LSKKVREIFNNQNLRYIKIIASSDLNEYRINDLIKQKAPIDSYGVGTELITAKPVAAIPGVYKLAEDSDGPKIKLSEGKETLPGKKQVYRLTGPDGKYCRDIIALEHEKVEGDPLLQTVVKAGKRVRTKTPLPETRTYCLDVMSKIPDNLKKMHVEKKYEVILAPELTKLINRLFKKYG
jgi:nicotinate phosphoribosyltransferase